MSSTDGEQAGYQIRRGLEALAAAVVEAARLLAEPRSIERKTPPPKSDTTNPVS